jgi:two-component system chemotaxis sensor kinase CheA
MHLIRNSMDHGIESPQLRLEQGKPPFGTISMKVEVIEGMMKIHLRDDGRGLALASIRRKAVERGLIDAEAVLSDETIAGQILLPGFSTAERVTEISGRGFGMDAVKDILGREKGSVMLRFLDDAVGADFRQFETVVSLPAHYAVHVDNPSSYHSQEEANEAEAGEFEISHGASSPVLGQQTH